MTTHLAGIIWFVHKPQTLSTSVYTFSCMKVATFDAKIALESKSYE